MWYSIIDIPCRRNPHCDKWNYAPSMDILRRITKDLSNQYDCECKIISIVCVEEENSYET